MEDRRTYSYNDDLDKYGMRLSPKISCNEEFYEEVMKDVDPNSKGIKLALEIYQSLNKKVVYDETFEAFKKDYDFLTNRDIRNITVDNSSVICSTWSLLYTHFLNRNGIDAVVNQAVSHGYVYFFADDHVVKAEATENLIDEKDNSKMSDLTRCKLDILPCGLMIYEKDKNNNIVEKNIFVSDFAKRNGFNYPEKHLVNYNLELAKKIEGKQILESSLEEAKDDDVVSKFSIMNEFLMEANLDTIGSMTYISNLLEVLFSEDEIKKISKDYLKVQKDDGVKFALLLTYYSGNSDDFNCYGFHQNVNGYNFLYTGEDGLSLIDKEQALNIQKRNDDIELSLADKNEYQNKRVSL